MPRTSEIATHLQRAALLTFTASLIFWAFFQIGKSPNFVTANPFADDPVDASGSIAVQVALAVSSLTLARAVLPIWRSGPVNSFFPASRAAPSTWSLRARARR